MSQDNVWEWLLEQSVFQLLLKSRQRIGRHDTHTYTHTQTDHYIAKTDASIEQRHANNSLIHFHLVTAVVAVNSSHVTVSSSALWSSFNSPSNVVSGHMSTMWFMVCHWPQSQEGDWTRLHCVDLHSMGLGLSGNGWTGTMCDEGDWMTQLNTVTDWHHRKNGKSVLRKNIEKHKDNETKLQRLKSNNCTQH